MKIRGNTIGIPNPQPNWDQTDPTQADYIRNKPADYVIVSPVQPAQVPALWFHTGNINLETVMLDLTSDGGEEVLANIDDMDYGVTNADASGIPTETRYSFDIED